MLYSVTKNLALRDFHNESRRVINRSRLGHRDFASFRLKGVCAMDSHAFLSYAHEDAADGYIRTLRTFVANEINLLTTGRFTIWYDRKDLLPGMRWWDEISGAIENIYFFMPIITSKYLHSQVCRNEFSKFLKREKQLGRNDLIIPIVYVPTPELDDPTPSVPMAPEIQTVIKEIRERQYSSWVHLRLKPFDDPEVRQEMNRIAVRVNSVLSTFVLETQSDKALSIQRKRGEIRGLLQTLTERIDRTSFPREFRADLMYGILKSAAEEVEKLSSNTSQYEQDLSLGENFIVRAGPVFAEADQVYAVSIDEYSGFWIAPDQRRRAEEYTSRQPHNTKRLFVFSNIENALKYQNVLIAHYQQYGSRNGAVLITSTNRWHEFLKSEVEAEQLTELLNKDFAILVYGTQPDTEFYIATLSETTLRLQGIQRLQSFHETIMKTFNRIAHQTDPYVEEQNGILKWRPRYGTPGDQWFNRLEGLFVEDQKQQPVYHIVLFASHLDFQKLENEINRDVQPRLMSIVHPVSKRCLVEDMWFGVRGSALKTMSPMDGTFGGRLITQNDIVDTYPHCLVLKFRSADDLRLYYEDPTHSTIRRQLLSELDPTIATVYETLERLNEEGRKQVFGAIEQAASRLMVRVDYMREGRSPIAVTPVPFSLPQRSQAGDD